MARRVYEYNPMAEAHTEQGNAGWMPSGRKFFTITELQRLKACVERRRADALRLKTRTPVRDWFLICVATETGLRVKEIADLDCGDFDSNGDWRSVIVRCGKGGKPRQVALRQEFISQYEQFRSWKRSIGESTAADAPVFVHDGRRMGKRALQKAFSRSLRRAGIDKPKGVGIHSLRHTYASHLLKASGFNLRLVQQQLGHASVRTTEVYAHVLAPDVKKAMERLYKEK